MMVTDKYGTLQNVDESRRRIYSYDAKAKTVEYSAPIIDENSTTEFWTVYEEKMQNLPTIEERLKVWNNTLLAVYAYSVDFNQNKNDNGGEKWKQFVKFVEENEEKFFTKTGDFRKKFLISTEEIAQALRNATC